jgi:hypothetical protein
MQNLQNVLGLSNLDKGSSSFRREVWNAKYEALALPENSSPIWTKAYTPDPLVASTVEISNGSLHIVATSASAETILWNQVPNFSDSVGVTVKFRMKMILGDILSNNSGNTYLAPLTGATDGTISIYTDGIASAFGSYEFDTTDQFHIYHITIKNGFVKIFVDGVLRLSGLSPRLDPAVLEFSATGAAVDTEQLWDYIYYNTDGDFPPQ